MQSVMFQTQTVGLNCWSVLTRSWSKSLHILLWIN